VTATTSSSGIALSSRVIFRLERPPLFKNAFTHLLENLFSHHSPIFLSPAHLSLLKLLLHTIRDIDKYSYNFFVRHLVVINTYVSRIVRTFITINGVNQQVKKQMLLSNLRL
jgi:hypothetical protein